MSLVRRIAVALTRHAARILPEGEAGWGRAMQAEIAHIERDGAALGWALGCVWTGYRQRMMAMSNPIVVLARVVLAAFVALQGLGQLSVAMMVLGYKTGNFGLAEANQGIAAGDDYRRFVPLMEQMSTTQLVLAFVQVGLFLAAAAGIALGRRHSPLLLVAAILLQFIGRMMMSALPAWRTTFSAAALRADLVTAAIFLLIALVAFWLTAPRPRSPGA